MKGETNSEGSSDDSLDLLLDSCLSHVDEKSDDVVFPDSQIGRGFAKKQPTCRGLLRRRVRSSIAITR